jgi:gluconate 2-dehydrogenase gamma chain
MKLKRRHFLLSASSALIATSVTGCGSSRSPYRLFDAAQAATLSALCEQIIPTDDTPGAAWAHVVKFIDRQLVYHYQDLSAAYRNGLANLERAALALHQASFHTLPFDTQTALVAQVEKGSLPANGWPANEQREFFRTVRNHTMQGYYGDPRHGGNRDMVGWSLVGLGYPPVRGRDDYLFPKNRLANAAAAPKAEVLRP